MKKIGILLGIFLLLSTWVEAVEYLSIHRVDGEDVEMLIAQIGRIEMGENELVLVGTNGTILASRPYGQVQCITFMDKQITQDESSVAVSEWPVVLPIRVFSPAGQLLLESYQTDVPMETLPRGVYILQSGLHVEKIYNR